MRTQFHLKKQRIFSWMSVLRLMENIVSIRCDREIYTAFHQMHLAYCYEFSNVASEWMETCERDVLKHTIKCNICILFVVESNKGKKPAA